MKCLGYGECGQVLLYNTDTIFKTYFSDTELEYRLSPKVFDILKDIDNAHLIKLFDIFSDMNPLYYKIRKLPFVIDAYTAKYYSEDSINVLSENKDYILDNWKELEILFKIFTNNAILTDDVKRTNTILTHNGIVIIDPDTFSVSEDSKSSIAIANKKNLLGLLREICVNDAINMYQKDIISRYQINTIIHQIDTKLIDIEVNRNTDISYEISKKLSYVKKPIDYLIQ